MDKYEMTEETIEWRGHKLHRIQSNTGKFGGFIESEKIYLKMDSAG